MADLSKKKNTSKMGHILSKNIRAAQIDDRDQDNPRFVVAFDNSEVESCLPVTHAVYDKIKKGTGYSHPRLRHGLLNCSKFRFQIVTDKVAARKGAEPSETIVAIHLIPDHPYNLCDWSEELSRRVEDDVAIASIDPETGSITVMAFPNRHVGQMDSFVAALEKITKIDGSTSFKAGSANYQVIQIYGNEVSFRCTVATAMR